MKSDLSMTNPNTHKPRSLRVVETGARLLPGALAPRQAALLVSLRGLALDADCVALVEALKVIEATGITPANLGAAVRAVSGIVAEASPCAGPVCAALVKSQAKDIARAANVLALLAAEIRRAAGR
jgi:hypothetical protein